MIPDHPDIAMALLTGYPRPAGTGGPVCTECGAAIPEDGEYYDVYGVIYCPRCMAWFHRWA